MATEKTIPATGVTPEKLAELAGTDLAFVESRVLQGRTPIIQGKISKRDALVVIRDAARAARATLASAPAPPPITASGPRAKLIRAEQLGKIADMLAQMIPNRTIRARLSVEWNLTPDTIEKMIAQAYNELAALGKIGQPARKDQLRDAFAEFYQQAMNIGDFKSASVALDRMARIDGCYAPTSSKVEVDASGEFAAKLNAPDAVRERMANLLKDPEILDKLDKLTKGS